MGDGFVQVAEGDLHGCVPSQHPRRTTRRTRPPTRHDPARQAAPDDARTSHHPPSQGPPLHRRHPRNRLIPRPEHPKLPAPHAALPTARPGAHAPPDQPRSGETAAPPGPTARSPTPRRSTALGRSTGPRTGSIASAFTAMLGCIPRLVARSPRSTSTPPGRSSSVRPRRRASSVAVGPRYSDQTCSTYGSLSIHRSLACAESGTTCRVRCSESLSIDP